MQVPLMGVSSWTVAVSIGVARLTLGEQDTASARAKAGIPQLECAAGQAIQDPGHVRPGKE
jgi:hypothetical protein